MPSRGEVPEGGELGLDPVEPRPVERHVCQLDVVGNRPDTDAFVLLGGQVRAEVVEHDRDPHLGRVQRAPFYGSWLNRIEAQFTALRYFALDGTDHPTHQEQSRMIRHYIAWRNRNAHDRELREVVKRANVA